MIQIRVGATGVGGAIGVVQVIVAVVTIAVCVVMIILVLFLMFLVEKDKAPNECQKRMFIVRLLLWKHRYLI